MGGWVYSRGFGWISLKVCWRVFLERISTLVKVETLLQMMNGRVNGWKEVEEVLKEGEKDDSGSV